MKVLVINGDDFGMCHSVNRGVLQAFGEGLLTQASIMAPAPWFEEAAMLTKTHDIPVGVHLTATCEWDYCRWQPITGRKSLTESDGTLHRTVEAVKERADRADLEAEYIAQVERVLAVGIRPQHLDVHMGMADDQVFARVCAAFGLKAVPSPCLLKAGRLDLCHQFDTFPGSRRSMEEELLSYLPLEGKMARFSQYLRELPDGVHYNLSHPAVDSDELASLCAPTFSMKDSARDRRVSDQAVLIDAGVRTLCAELGIGKAAVRDLPA